jgi:hypothetical protein
MRTLVLALAFLFATDDALELLDPSEPRDAKVARWSAGGKDLWVATGVYDEELITAVLRKRNGDYTLVAKSDGVTPLTNEPPWSVSVNPDLIPFRISDQDIAFGVRVSNSYHSTARASSTEALHLFRLHKGELTMVFAALLDESDSEFAQDGSDDRIVHESHRVVIVSKTKHKGFYDLIVRDRKTKRSETWRWNGSEYVH